MSTVSVNTHFPGYEILGELGHSNARVLKARDLATGELVAIKHFTLGTDADTLRRFQQESDIMTSIRHPNVVPVRAVHLDRPLPFIVMEWVEGGDLRSLLTRQGVLDVPTIIRLGQQMAGAFRAIHPAGIIHRDIKPENILYRPLPSGELHFLLTDFGVARLREQSQTMTGQSLMTYEYASPEQFDNPRGVTPATDYYSLGVVLYECLLGRVPFSLGTAGGMATFMNQVLRSPAPMLALPPDQFLPPSLDTLITWMLTKNPDERLSDVTELTLLLGQAGVEQLQAGRSGSVPVSSRSQTRAAPVVQRPEPIASFESTPNADGEASTTSGWWGILVGMIVVGLMIGGVFYYKARQSPPVTSFTPDSTQTMSDSTTLDELPTDNTTPFSESAVEETPTDSAQTSPNLTPAENTTASSWPTVATDTTVVKDTVNHN